MVRVLGISLQLFTLAILAFTLSACATLFDYSDDRDPASLDRGYANEEDQDCDTQECEEAPQPSHREYVSKLSPEKQRIQSAIAAKDIVLGMSRANVLRSWGEPAQRRQAGKGAEGHELWLYGMRNSLQGERVIIFENGLVAGWER